jgi:hypothetical protein
MRAEDVVKQANGSAMYIRGQTTQGLRGKGAGYCRWKQSSQQDGEVGGRSVSGRERTEPCKSDVAAWTEGNVSTVPRQ